MAHQDSYLYISGFFWPSFLGAIQPAPSTTLAVSIGQIFEKIFGYEGIKRTFLRSLTSKEPVHILLVGPPGQADWTFVTSWKLVNHGQDSLDYGEIPTVKQILSSIQVE
jgi:hypothetical protein